MTVHRAAVDRLLGHLQLSREAPRLDYLDRIVREHQLRVPFETLTKLIDYEPGLRAVISCRRWAIMSSAS